jgi:hypothetical protein
MDLRRSRVLVLKNLLVLEHLKTKSDFLEVEDDVYDECKKYGRVERVIVPKPPHMEKRRISL